MTSGFTNLFIGRQRINRQFEPLQSGASQIGNTFTNLGAVAQNCQTPISLDPAKRLANWLCRFWMTCQVNSLWSEGHFTNELSPISFSIKKLTKFLQGRQHGHDRSSTQHNPSAYLPATEVSIADRQISDKRQTAHHYKVTDFVTVRHGSNNVMKNRIYFSMNSTRSFRNFFRSGSFK